MNENELSKVIVDVCFKVHWQYGPGLLESVYENIFCHEFEKTGIPFSRQVGITIIHEHLKLEGGFRADVIVDEKVLIEMKSVETLAEVHLKQVQTYLKLTGLKLGLLINFNTAHIKDGIKRLVNKL